MMNFHYIHLCNTYGSCRSLILLIIGFAFVVTTMIIGVSIIWVMYNLKLGVILFLVKITPIVAQTRGPVRRGFFGCNEQPT
jgi:hypothetical protein